MDPSGTRERSAYDYVVVGAGSAGCVLASRLSEDPDTTVLLLEAGGPDRDWAIRVPAAFSRLFRSRHDWAFRTEAESRLGGRELYIPRGKVLGGSSSINAMIYVRGNRYDYDHWRDLGNPGWGYADLLPYFRRAENQERGASEYHGAGGPLNVADLREVNPLTRAFVAAAREVGIPPNDDFNGAVQEGVGVYQVTQRGGRRHSAADAYLHPAAGRRNLTVRTGAYARRLVLEGGRVAGVEYRLDGALERGLARREVLLCAGAIGSPQLLMLSGIGPAAHLRSLGVDVVHDLPGVGANLQDHLAGVIVHRCTQPVSLIEAERLRSVLRYLLFRTGPLASNVSEAGAFVRLRPEAPAPELQVGFVPAYALDRGFDRPPGHFFSVGCTVLRPESRGAVRLRSADPDDPPVIRPDFLSAETDLRATVQGLRLCRRIASARPFDPFRGEEVHPGAEVDADEALEAYVRRCSQTVDHPVGTCRMGPDAGAVVDAELRLRGLAGLRVVDASVMPTLVSGNTNAPVIAIAEKAADLIRASRSPGGAREHQALATP